MKRHVSFFIIFACGAAVAHAQQEGALAEGSSESGPSKVEQRELGANEDPLDASNAQRDARKAEEKAGEPKRRTGFDIYGSLRVRYRERAGETTWEDGSSRIGIESDWQFQEGSFLFGRYEAGFNVLSTPVLDQSREEFEDNVFTRLLHVGVDTSFGNVIAGKNWSTYYEVGSFTDRFMGAGGDASGVYNAQTDGGPTGTGRADSILQAKLSMDFLPHTVYKPYDLNVQVQHGNAIPFGDGANYGTAVGISSVRTTQRNDFTIGMAYNHATIDLDDNPSLRDVGLSGDAQALLIGTRAFGKRWYAGLVLARLKNHMTTDEGIYFNGWGSEFYGQYRISNRWWLTGGYNVLEPDSDQVQAGDYRIRYGVVGLRYSFEDFRRMIFVNARINDGMNADGTPQANVYTIGVRWDLSKRGWHVSN